jgi:acetyl esterase/lipase
LTVVSLACSLSAAELAQQRAGDQAKPDAKKPEEKPAKPDDKKPVKKPPMPSRPATMSDVKYGSHERQVLDFYQAKSDKPTPLIFFIHGGGWQAGDKRGVGDVDQFLKVGISVVAINYRYVRHGVEDKVEPPVKAPLHDAARALQFVRSKAAEWNIDKKRIGATGGSAGGCSSLWLAFHDDLADPKSTDPIARESTRLYCAAVNGAQTSLDPKELKEWMPNYSYGSHAFGLKDLNEVMEKREKILPWIKEYSPIEHVSKDDPPIGLYYKGEEGAKPGESRPDPTHSPVLGMLLAVKLKANGIDMVLSHTGKVDAKLPTSAAYLIDRLKK